MSHPSGGSRDIKAPKGSREEPELEEAFDRLVEEGHTRLDRPLLPLVATGLLGGVDVGVGVLMYLVVDAKTDNPLLASLAFTVGFVALLLANSELFTENFLVPVISVVAKVGTVSQLVRLWGVTLLANLVAGFAMAAMIVVALPEVHGVAVKAGSHYAHLGVSWRSFFLAVLAGAVITLLTRMQHATDDLGPQLVAAVMMSFVLVGSPAVPFGARLDPDVLRTAERRRRLRIPRLARSPRLGDLRQPHRGARPGHLGTPAPSAPPRRGEPRAGPDRLTPAGDGTSLR